MKKNHKIIFILILLLAGVLRFYRLGQIPSSLNWDEISHGYNAYSLLQTGKDQWGVSWPLFNFRAYGDYPTAANLYLTIPFIKYLGLTAFAVRLPAAIFGLIFVIFVYLFAKIFFKNEDIALITAFITAISPWTVFPSRAVFQSNLSQTFIIMGLYFFFSGLKKPKSLILSALFFGISLYSYHNARLIIPLLIPVLIYFYSAALQKIFTAHRFIIFFSSLLFLLFLIPNLLNLFSPESTARNRWVGIINPNSINLINEKRRLFTGPQIINLALNNKVVYFLQSITVNYFDLLNPLPLFFRGSENYQFNPPNTGLIFLIFLPFFYFGLIKFIINSRHDLNYLVFMVMFFICLFPAAVTSGDYPSIRATAALPFYFIFIAGAVASIKNKKIILLIVLIALVELVNYLKIYSHYNQSSSFAWQYGYQSAVGYIKDNYSDYSRIIVTKKYGEPHEFILFYWPWNPQKYLSDPNKKTDFHADWYWVDSFDKFTFINDWEIISQKFAKGTLLITSPKNYPAAKSKLLKTINFLDGSPAFDIIKYE